MIEDQKFSIYTLFSLERYLDIILPLCQLHIKISVSEICSKTIFKFYPNASHFKTKSLYSRDKEQTLNPIRMIHSQLAEKSISNIKDKSSLAPLHAIEKPNENQSDCWVSNIEIFTYFVAF